jgi:polysaccharide biosynthesis protein PslH
MNILFLSAWYPFPPNNGSKLRVYNLLRGLSTKHKISLLSFVDQPGVDSDSKEIRSICEDVQIIPSKLYKPNSMRARLGFFSLAPRSVVDGFSKEMQTCINRTLLTLKYDLIIASQWSMARYCRSLREIPVLFEEAEVSVFYDQFAHATSARHRLRYGLTWFKYRNFLAHLLHSSSACTVASEQERKLIIRNVSCHTPIEVIPNGINLPDYQGIHEYPQPDTLIFTGSFRYYANYDAMNWFLAEVFPLIQAEVPEVRLMITGDHAGLPLPSSMGVTLTGFVDDVRPLVARSAVSLAPIRIGGGTRLKILEAMTLRIPVVSTSKGAEGLDIRHEKNILIADTPTEYAKAVIRLLREADIRKQLAESAYQLVSEQYNWAIIMPRFLSLIENITKSEPLSAGSYS